MINTYHTSMAPPPVPPRHAEAHPVLYPVPPPSKSHSRSTLRFLVGVVLLQVFLTIGGFIYLAHFHKTEKCSLEEGKVSYLLSEQQKDVSTEMQRAISLEKSYKPLARMIVDKRSRTEKFTPGILQWDTDHSTLRNISFFYKKWLTVEKSGYYFLYSKVSFSKYDSQRPLASRIMLRESKEGKETVSMQASCSLNLSMHHTCTAYQGEVVALKEGNQIAVWVQDLSLVDYEQESTTFGMYEL